MKNYLIAVSSLFLLSLTACKDTGKEPSNITIDGAATEQPANTAPEATPATETTPVQNAATPVASTPAASNQGAAASGINPAHGQPGHRCDIPVGAPLSTPAGGGSMQGSATPAASSQGQPFLVNDQAKGRIMQEQGQSTSSGKINPPHGQPGHRCDIQVGQPLP